MNDWPDIWHGDPFDNEFQIHSNKLPGVINGHALREQFYICLY